MCVSVITLVTTEVIEQNNMVDNTKISLPHCNYRTCRYSSHKLKRTFSATTPLQPQSNTTLIGFCARSSKLNLKKANL